MDKLIALAQAWLLGWDAGIANWPESRCPFIEGQDGSFKEIWHRGWEAGCRGTPGDRIAKRRFLDLSLGLTREIPEENAQPPQA